MADPSGTLGLAAAPAYRLSLTSPPPNASRLPGAQGTPAAAPATPSPDPRVSVPAKLWHGAGPNVLRWGSRGPEPEARGAGRHRAVSLGPQP